MLTVPEAEHLQLRGPGHHTLEDPVLALKWVGLVLRAAV